MSDVSSESSFYGSPEQKAKLENHLDRFDPLEALKLPPTFIEAVLRDTAAAALRAQSPTQTSAAWQLGEDIDHFLQRLPPSTTRTADAGPWIWVADPNAERNGTNGDPASLVREGEVLLQKLLNEKDYYEEHFAHKGPVAFDRAFDPIREQYGDRILAMAKKYNLTSGKWMIFARARDIDRIWKIIAGQTVRGNLGVGAKVATANATDPHWRDRVICVYTKDFDDRVDVIHVLRQMQALGLLPESPHRGIYYKPDAYTYLGINSGNKWDIQPSLYASRDLLVGTKNKRASDAMDLDPPA